MSTIDDFEVIKASDLDETTTEETAIIGFDTTTNEPVKHSVTGNIETRIAAIESDISDLEKDISDLENDKVNTADIATNLTTDDDTKILSAKQGKILEDNKRAISAGYLLSQTLYYTSGATWTKADYPGLKAAKVICTGAGGAAGGVKNGETQAAGGGGGAGQTCIKFILAADLDTTETIVIGAGGTGESAADGNVGGDTTFGATKVVAKGGLGGLVGGTNRANDGGASSSTGGVGDVVFAGGAGTIGNVGTLARGGTGGSSYWGGGQTPDGITGADGVCYGSGGSGAGNSASSANKAGGAGAGGICIVEIYI